MKIPQWNACLGYAIRNQLRELDDISSGLLSKWYSQTSQVIPNLQLLTAHLVTGWILFNLRLLIQTRRRAIFMWMVMSELMLWLIDRNSVKYGLTGIFQEWNLMKDQIWFTYRLNYLFMNQRLCLCSVMRVCLMQTKITGIVTWRSMSK